MSEGASELRPAYRTLDQPTRLLGLALAHWAVLAVAFALGYVWMRLSPLDFRLASSIAALVLGTPAGFLVLFSIEGLPVGRVARGIWRWRVAPSLLSEPRADGERRPGVVVLNAPLDSLRAEPSRRAEHADA